jgi:uncharacterized protein (TIGR02600 family)
MNHYCTTKLTNHTPMNPCNASPRVLRGKLNSPEQGMALVIVLGMLVILLGLAITFLSRVRVDRASSGSFAASATTRQLADSAVNLVQGQIRNASTLGRNVAWTSQPGMIRTFASGAAPNLTASSSLYRVYKLYSATQLISTAYTAGADTPPATWATDRAVWTDLNAPAPGPDNTLIYPILDPGASNSVEGFTITNAPTTGTPNPAPMPVRWLYQLRDGSLVAASGSGTNASVAGAHPQNNPIVGRIAFWTDDETCKVNINTASEGIYWDTPRLTYSQDIAFANYQPTQKEFQRYPGHPAMTSLAPVFFATNSTSTPPLTKDQRDALYEVTPRIVGGGSDAGTVIANGALTPDSDRLYASVDELMFAMPPGAGTRPVQDPNATITADKIRKRAFFLTANSRAPEVTLFNTPRVAMWPIYKLNAAGALDTTRTTAYDKLIAFCSTIGGQPYFFQRQDSRSPDNDWVTIPRNQELLRYLQTLSGKAVPGFGASLVSKTTAADRDQLLVSMLDYIRSTNLYDDNLSANTYTTQAAAENAPQFTTGRKITSTEAWQGHGLVVPLRVPQGLTGIVPAPGAEIAANRPHIGFGRFHTIAEAGLLFICNADGKNGTFNAPLNDDNTPMPLAMVPTKDQLARMISNVAPGAVPANRTFNYNLNQADPANPTVIAAPGTLFPESRMLSGGIALAADQRRIQMMLFFDLFSPMQGWTMYSMDGSMDVEVTGTFNVGGNPVTLASALETVNFDNAALNAYHPWGGSLGFRRALSVGLTASRRAVGEPGGPPTALNRYGLISTPFTVTVPANGLMAFAGPTKITVKFYGRQKGTGRIPDRSDADLVQTIELKFPDADFPIPDLMTMGTPAIAEQASATSMYNWWALNYEGPFATLPPFVPPISYLGGKFGRLATVHQAPNDLAGNFIRSGDTLKTLVPYHADTRLVAGSSIVPAGVFQPTTFYFSPLPADRVKSYMTGSGRSDEASAAHFHPPLLDRLVSDASYDFRFFPKFSGFATSDATRSSARPYQKFGDFDNGVATVWDGAYINKPDEGNIYRAVAGRIPYFDQDFAQAAGGITFFSPNRQIPGPGMFGSLPANLWSANTPLAGANANNTWRTLLLRPQTGHPGANNPPDHLWTDLFWMPVVEPYAISEPFSTAGKINMNYAIEPFRYIARKTGMVALLRSEKIPAIATSNAASYKSSTIAAPNTTPSRLDLNIEETLRQWDTKFANNEVFISSSQLCDLHLVPQGQTIAGMPAFWTANALTGDNSRERPYANLLGRLTTKSNTYTIHYRVQALKQPPTATAGQWDETRGIVTGEFRGSTTIERYITPKDANIPDYAAQYATNPAANIPDLGTFYKWRTLNTRQFAP